MTDNFPQPLKKTAQAIPDELIASALKANRGLQYLTADAIGMSYTYLSRRINDSEYLKTIRDECVQKRLDVAEENLSKLVENGELGAICFFLKTIGKSRGYIETTQLAIPAHYEEKLKSLMDHFTNAQSSLKIEDIKSINE